MTIPTVTPLAIAHLVRYSKGMENYFTLLGLEVSPEVDGALLKSRYFEAQKACHPDKATGAEERARMLQRSADVNAAYQTLKAEDTRLYYLLKLNGHDVLSDAVQASPELLMASMEWREELMDIEDQDALQAFASRMAEERRAVIAACSAAITEKKWEAAVASALRLRYLTKVEQEVAQKQKTLA